MEIFLISAAIMSALLVVGLWWFNKEEKGLDEHAKKEIEEYEERRKSRKSLNSMMLSPSRNEQDTDFITPIIVADLLLNNPSQEDFPISPVSEPTKEHLWTHVDEQGNRSESVYNESSQSDSYSNSSSFDSGSSSSSGDGGCCGGGE